MDYTKLRLRCLKHRKTRLLGDNPFLFGSEATTADCALFACLSCVLAGDPADDSAFRREVNRFPLKNLRRHWVRMKETFWADWDDKLHKDG